MPNPILPLWEYIPDGEPRVFGDRVYLYGSHDTPGTDLFCDTKLKVWSASVDDLSNWQCHGHIFHTNPDSDHKSDTPWTDHRLFAPDVVEKDGKYYLYAYIQEALGCVAVSDKPEGPFELLSTYKYNNANEAGDGGLFIDPGVLVDDDGRVYVYYGYLNSFMNELNPDNMYEVIDGTFKAHVMPEQDDVPKEKRYFEGSSPRKINGLYYFIYSPHESTRLAYATSTSPEGPFEYRGYIIDNGVDHPQGNDHGSLCKIKDQWYIFYHRMTNNTIMSRRACVEKVEILPDGTIPPVEMTCLGFDDYLSPYEITKAEIACVVKGGCYVTEKDMFTRVVTNIKKDCVLGYKYFEFGEDYSTETMLLSLNVKGMGCKSKVRVLIDDYENGTEIGYVDIGLADGVYQARVKNVTGRHAVYFVTEQPVKGWMADSFTDKQLFEFDSFVFSK